MFAAAFPDLKALAVKKYMGEVRKKNLLFERSEFKFFRTSDCVFPAKTL